MSNSFDLSNFHVSEYQSLQENAVEFPALK